MYYHRYVAVYVVTHSGMDPGAAIVTRPSQQGQVFDHSPNLEILHKTCVLLLPRCSTPVTFIDCPTPIEKSHTFYLFIYLHFLKFY